MEKLKCEPSENKNVTKYFVDLFTFCFFSGFKPYLYFSLNESRVSPVYRVTSVWRDPAEESDPLVRL